MQPGSVIDIPDSNPFKAILALLILVTLFAFPVSQASARPRSEDITIEGTFGFNGYFKENTPSPLHITVSNSGEILEGWALANLEAWAPPTFYTRPLLIPPGGSQQFELGCFGCLHGPLCEVPVEIYSADGDLLKTALLPSYLLKKYDTLFIHLGEPENDIERLFEGLNPGYLEQVRLQFFRNPTGIDYPPRIFPVILEPEDLPESEILLEGVGLIVTDLGHYRSLGQSTRDLLLAYVRHGGNLLVYYRDDGRPVEAWESEPLLPVVPLGEFATVSLDSFLSAYDRVVPEEQRIINLPDQLLSLSRRRLGEVVIDWLVPSEEVKQEEVAAEVLGAFLANLNQEWDPPHEFPVISVRPTVYCEEVHSDDFESPILVVRNIGSGHCAFAAFNPFEGDPTALAPPIMLLSAFGLLSPRCPIREYKYAAVVAFHHSEDRAIREFFGRLGTQGLQRVLHWVDAIGIPTLVYLLGLPIIAVVAWRRTRLGIAVFICWSVLLTGFTPVSDKAKINEANLYWCEALPSKEGGNALAGAARLLTSFSYAATTPTPRTISWDSEGALLDEYILARWPYGSVTIEEAGRIRLPDLPFEVDAFRPIQPGVRDFIYRRPAPEMSASGELVIGPDYSHLTVDAELPFPAITGRLLVSGDGLEISKSLGPLDMETHLDFDLEEGVDIAREENLFPGWHADLTEQLTEANQAPEQNIRHLLQAFWDYVLYAPVSREQSYALYRATGRPSVAFIVMATNGMASEISVDRGQIERRALTLMLLTVPIVYQEHPTE